MTDIENSEDVIKPDMSCPFCGTNIYDKEGIEIDKPCTHIYSIGDGFVDWGEDYEEIYKLGNIHDNEGWIFDKSEKENLVNYLDDIKNLTKGLTIDNKINFDSYWDIFDFEHNIEKEFDDIIIINESFDGGSPGGNGVFPHLFIKDWRKVKIIFDDLKVLYQKILKLEKKIENEE